MGCGQSQKPAAPAQTAVDVTPQDKVIDATWATKTEVTSPDSKPRGGSDSARQQPVVLQDAEDDLEVEILTERQQEARPDPLPGRSEQAANAQEAPSSLSEPSPQPSPSRPLPKQQQEEAAKLAETRRRFDNQRYQREHQSGAVSGTSGSANTSPTRGSLPNSFGGLPGALPGAPDMDEEFDKPSRLTGNAGAAASGGASGPKAGGSDSMNRPVVIGLSLNKTQDGMGDGMQGGNFLPGGIPGGINDDELPGSMNRPIRKEDSAAKHQQNLASFSADDEALMREILEDVDDLET